MLYTQKETKKEITIIKYSSSSLIDTLTFLGNKFISASVNGHLQFKCPTGMKTIKDGVLLMKSTDGEIDSVSEETLHLYYIKKEG